MLIILDVLVLFVPDCEAFSFVVNSLFCNLVIFLPIGVNFFYQYVKTLEGYAFEGCKSVQVVRFILPISRAVVLP